MLHVLTCVIVQIHAKVKVHVYTLKYMYSVQQTDVVKKNSKPEQKSSRGSTIEVYNSDVYDKLSEIAEMKGTSIRRLVNDLFEMYLERDDSLKKYIPQLTKINFMNGILYIQDSEKNQMAEVGINNKSKIFCKLCKSTECVHVVFAIAQMELSRLEPMK